jgi:hypothetical protein
MVNRIQNRNSGYSDAALFSKGPMKQNNSVNSSISGATALKLDEQFEVSEVQQTPFDLQEEKMSIQDEVGVQNNKEEQFLNTSEKNSFENETAKEKLSEDTLFELDSIEQVTPSEETAVFVEEEYTPKLFSEETSLRENNSSPEIEQKLFDQENSQEEDFEIPAFLRRQKF